MKYSLFLGLFLAFTMITAAIAQESNRVALVIALGDGEVITQCVEFSEDEISGFDALSRAGLELQTEIVGLGATVCGIEGSGCPANDCFCQCKGGGPCLYWSYWHADAGEWKYSAIGAGNYQLSDGDVDGWVWGVGSPNEAPPPPAISFEEVCALEPVTEVASALQPDTPDMEEAIPSATDAAGPIEESNKIPPTPGAAPVVPASDDQQPESGTQVSLYAVFGLIFAGFATAFILARRGNKNA